MNFDIPEHLPSLIDGHDSPGGDHFDNLNPADGSLLCTVAIAADEEINRAFAAARRARIEWRALPPARRAIILNRAADLLEKYNDVLAEIETRDSGRPIRETISVDVVSAVECLRFIAGAAASFSGRYVELGGGEFALATREPLGTCLGIGAWNYPLQIAAWKSAPALAMGNAFIFKPSELTPLTAWFLGRIYREAGLPDGLFQVINGRGETGARLVAHSEVDKVSLTGSVETGRKIYEQCGKDIKKVSLELGGKGPLVVRADADIDAAVQGSLFANFYSQGLICSNGTRVFVQREVYEKFVSRLAEQVQKIVVGDPADMATHMGPMISSEHRQKVAGYIEAARREGARFVFEGNKNDGNYISPVVLADCSDDMTCCREEIFGPVMSILSFDSDEEVMRRANQTPYGLAGAVYTESMQWARWYSEQLQVGVCWINTYNITPVEVPFNGIKQSGVGVENGTEVLYEYSRNKTVYYNSSGQSMNFFD